MTDHEFMALVDAGVESLPPEMQRHLKNVAITIADEPSADQREVVGLHPDEVVFGLYEGVPQADRGLIDEVLLPDKVTIFKLPILAAYDDPADIKECVANTVWHELAHHLGWDEEWITAEERRRGMEL